MEPEVVLRLVVLPVERLVRLFWSTVPAERVVEVELPALRLVVAEEALPVDRLVVPLWVLVDRLVRSFWLAVPAERVVEEELLRLVVAEEVLPAERLVVPL